MRIVLFIGGLVMFTFLEAALDWIVLGRTF